MDKSEDEDAGRRAGLRVVVPVLSSLLEVPLRVDWRAVETHARRSSEMTPSAVWIKLEMVAGFALSTSPRDDHHDSKLVSA